MFFEELIELQWGTTVDPVIVVVVVAAVVGTADGDDVCAVGVVGLTVDVYPAAVFT